MRSSLLRKSDYKLRPLRPLGEWLAAELPVSRSAISKPTIAALVERFAPEPQSEGNDEAGSPVPKTMAPPAATKRPGLPIKGLISALVGVALVPTANSLRSVVAGHDAAARGWRDACC
jgi:hypothetical protein